MAFRTRQEFAEDCGTTIAVINTNVSRKKISVLLRDKGIIDDENPLNKIFKKNRIALNKQRKAEEVAEKKAAKVDKQKEKEGFKKVIKEAMPDNSSTLIDEIFSEEDEEEKQEKQDEEDDEIVNWELRKKIADALKAERAAELQLIQIEKLNGNLMPVDLVTAIFDINIKDIFKGFENELLNIASIYCDQLAGGDRTALAEITEILREKLNETIKRIEETAEAEIENLIDSYAESRNRGEKK